MCIICVSRSGVRQPGEAAIRAMFLNNPHGAGYMVARGGRVEIHKGFMNLGDYLRAIRAECFTLQDSVVYHFRISTQAGVGPEMTHLLLRRVQGTWLITDVFSTEEAVAFAPVYFWTRVRRGCNLLLVRMITGWRCLTKALSERLVGE